MSGAEQDTPSRLTLRQLLSTWQEVPAFLRDRYLTVVASNDLARALSPAFTEGANLARFTFLDRPPGRRTARCEPLEYQVAAMLRESVDHHRDDGHFRVLVGELSALSREFATAWASPVRIERTGEVELHSDTVGALTMTYTELLIPDDDEDRLLIWRSTDQSSRDALGRLRDQLVAGT
ncbi:MAG: hypothetical protein ABJD68_10515 [Nakamurella sp.]